MYPPPVPDLRGTNFRRNPDFKSSKHIQSDSFASKIGNFSKSKFGKGAIEIALLEYP